MSATKPKVPTRWRYRRHVDPAAPLAVERVIVAEVEGHDTPTVIARIENPARGHPAPGGTIWLQDWAADEVGRMMASAQVLRLLLSDLGDAAERMVQYYAFLFPEEKEEGYPPEVAALREQLVRLTAHKVRRMPK